MTTNPLISAPQIDDTIPVPQRPGTFWMMRHQDGVSWCDHCGKDYNRHGGNTGLPESFAGVDLKVRTAEYPWGRAHLTCPAPDAEWDRWYNAQRRSNLSNFTEFFRRELSLLSPEDRQYVLYVLQNKVSYTR